jgi:hypothetical protein
MAGLVNVFDQVGQHEHRELLLPIGGLNLAKTKIVAKCNTVSQSDRLHGGIQRAHAA